MLLEASAPGRVSLGKEVSGEGPDKVWSPSTHEQSSGKKRDPARRMPGAPLWSQARREGSTASAWWPGLPRSPAGHSPNEIRGHTILSTTWAHHPRPDAVGSGALPDGWQRHQNFWTDQTRAAEADFRDVERLYADGEGTGPGAGG